MNIFCENLQIPSFYFKEQLQKNSKVKICKNFFYFPKMVKTVFNLKREFLFIFLALKKISSKLCFRATFTNVK